MIKKTFYVFLTVCIVLLVGAVGFFSPKFVSAFQDKKEEGARENIELEEVVLKYGTEPDLIEKLQLFRYSQPIYTYPLSETNMTHADAEQKAIAFLVSVLPDTGGDHTYCFSEPMGTLFGNGETISVWYVHISLGYRFEGCIIIDDQSGLILSFQINDFSESIKTDEIILEYEETDVLDPVVFAEKIIESYGILNCKYENGYILIPVSERENLMLNLECDAYGIMFNSCSLY